MLTSLTIQNYALIDSLDISLDKGFSVITGETGAGKSIILGAIGLLLGQRADSKSIKHPDRRCTIEARFALSGYGLDGFFTTHDFDFDGNECIIRREIMPTGKSRAFINDTPAQVAQLKELGSQLIDVHSQHQNLLLDREDFQRNVIDILAADERELEDYRNVYRQYKEVGRRLKAAREELEKSKADEDYLTFQWEQLDQAGLKSGEQEELEQETETLSHAEDIKQALFQAEALLSADERGITALLKDARHHVESLRNVYSPADELASRLESCYIELKDLADELAGQAESIDFNPARLQEAEERLNTIYSLQQKHHVQTVDELIALAEDYRIRLDGIHHGDEHITALQQQQQKLFGQLVKQADTLTRLRQKAAKQVETLMQEKLIPLGIPNAQFRVELTQRDEPDENGTDRISFLFSANKGGTPQPISQVTSGGEIARVMLSLKAMISGAVKLPTIIFDEIDTGVSGQIAEKMALIMQDMGAHDRQVISITHLPQIAARGKAHYKVYKQEDEHGTTSHITRLTDSQRVEEIAHMLSGATLSEAALNNARVLLNL
ncbi:MAG: DNA repair protein RecN [Clostridium sp.]|nr:DNA repair protein RecN [Clostridium sp.]